MSSLVGVLKCALTCRNDDNNKEDDNADDQTHAHLHILPPHLLPNTIGSTSKALCGSGEIFSLPLGIIDLIASNMHGIDVLLHYADGIIDLLLKVISECPKHNGQLEGGAPSKCVENERLCTRIWQARLDVDILSNRVDCSTSRLIVLLQAP